MVPPLTYHFVCRAKRSLACALAGPARLHGYEFAASVAMIYMLLTVH